MKIFQAVLITLAAFVSHELRADVLTGPITNIANGHLYFLLSPTNWLSAEGEAVNLGGHLVTLNDVDENAWVTNAFGTFGGVARSLWIGLNDSAAEGDFVWVSGDPATYRNWATGEPNSGGGFFPDEDHAVMRAPDVSFGGAWNDAPSNQIASSVAEVASPIAPTIVLHPQSQTVSVSETVAFSVGVSSTFPFSYQWALNGTNINGATASSFWLTNVQFADAGSYSVVVSNSLGTDISADAVLTVNPAPPCAPAPAGLVGWWRADSNALDSLGGNHGALAGNTVYGQGRVDKAFIFDGSGDGVIVGNQASLQLQNFTIEAWIKRGSATTVSLSPNPSDCGLVAYGNGGYGLGMYGNGDLYLTKTGVDAVSTATGITNTDWHHVAITKSNNAVVFYVDGVAYPAPAYNSVFTFGASLAIGANSTLAYSFLGSIDEAAIYNRPLAEVEIQSIYNASLSGKCPVLAAPFIVTHPRNTNRVAGANVTFSTVAGGSLPLIYQWRFNDTNIANATNSTLTLSNLQFSQIGNYSVAVTNPVSSVVSSNAALTVVFPNAVVRAGSTNVMAGRPVVVPITLVANGNENSFGFSLNFNTQRLAFASAALGSGANGASLLVNTSLIATGRLGLAITLPPQSNFAPGTQEVALITFTSFPLTGVTTNTNTLSFADQPLLRELSDAQLQPLFANYSNGTVLLIPTVFESDVAPRTNGNQIISTTDWLQVGHFVARLDAVATNEFQRADCAPRTTSGDGQLKVTDWVQAGRHLAGLDPLAVVGGPVSETAPTLAGSSASRQLRVVNANTPPAQVVTVAVNLEAQGDENAVGFTLAFDSSAFMFVGVTLGSDAVGANFTPNTSQVGSGKLGVILALPTASAFSAGTKQLALVSLLATPSATGVFPATLTDQLVTRCVSDAQADELAVTYFNGNITVNSTNSPPSLAIARSSNNVVVSWPAWAGDYVLQWADGTDGLPGAWTNTPGPLQTNGGNILSTLPLTNQTKLFRLRR